MHIRDAGPEDHDAVVALGLAEHSALRKWIAAAADDPDLAAHAMASWSFGIARLSGGVLVSDDLSGYLIWSGERRTKELRDFAAGGVRIGGFVYPNVPQACQQRAYDLSRLTGRQRIVIARMGPIRLGGVVAPTPDLVAALLQTFVERVVRLRREWFTVTSSDGSAGNQLEDIGFLPTHDIAAFGDRPTFRVWRRPGARLL